MYLYNVAPDGLMAAFIHKVRACGANRPRAFGTDVYVEVLRNTYPFANSNGLRRPATHI